MINMKQAIFTLKPSFFLDTCWICLLFFWYVHVLPSLYPEGYNKNMLYMRIRSGEEVIE